MGNEEEHQDPRQGAFPGRRGFLIPGMGDAVAKPWFTSGQGQPGAPSPGFPSDKPGKAVTAATQPDKIAAIKASAAKAGSPPMECPWVLLGAHLRRPSRPPASRRLRQSGVEDPDRPELADHQHGEGGDEQGFNPR